MSSFSSLGKLHVHKSFITQSSLINKRYLKKLYTPIRDINHNKSNKLLYNLNFIYDHIVSKGENGKLPSILLENNQSTKKPISVIKSNKQFINWLERYTLQVEEKEILSLKEDNRNNVNMIALRTLLTYIKQVNYDIDVGIVFKMCISLIQLYDNSDNFSKRQQLEEFISLIKKMETKLRLLTTNDITKQEIQSLIDSNFKQHKTVLESILKILNYRITSQDQVRIVRSESIDDQIDIHDGWKLLNGIKSDNNRYLSSMNFLDTTSRKNLKVMSLNGGIKTLVIDGITIRSAEFFKNMLNYLKLTNQSIVIFINGDIKNEALVDISMWNNKNKREGLTSKCIIIPVRDNDSTVIEGSIPKLSEDLDFLNFINLPNGQLSILNDFTPIDFQSLQSAEDFELFFGEIDSIKFTNGESFIYSKQGSAKINELLKNYANEGYIFPKSLKTTITLKCGGETLIEMDDKRTQLDYILNEFLYSLFTSGGIKTSNVYFLLNKIVRDIVAENEKDSTFISGDKYTRIFEELILENNCMGNHKNIESLKALNEYLQNGDNQDETKIKNIEPLSRLANSLFVVLNFIKLFCTTDVVITNQFDGKKLAWNILDKKMRNFFG
ncbi:hypothetical protein HANVADRAFT_52223 [Hanseniaspora valbyensis NRRL Y-1626]|uniref:Mitochondrial chaperone TCM62 n=1 Tax=Hanseniaspora valbyensis NRRL Y-1626 TaxID=766949 RepID=A0A1B7TFJ4_9ASCO|nr:hypothetical protein HANVADRAFT_52223 [Hanseniaspora valbyensis NRRL Y-1626]